MSRKKIDFDMDSYMSGKPDKPSKPAGLSSKPSKPGYKRQTYIIREDYIEKIRAVAHWERKEITQVINELLAESLKDKKPG